MMQNLVDEIVNSLRQYQIKGRQDFSSTLAPTSMEVIGIGAKEMRIVLKELQGITKSWTYEEKIKLALDLIKCKILEVQVFAYEFLTKDKSVLQNLKEKDLHLLNQNLDNWASVDSYSGYLMGPAWRMGIVSDKKIKEFLKSEDVWQRRIAVVSTVSLNVKAQGGTGDAKRTLDICKLVISDHHDMIVKALSWALRALSKRDKEAVLEFINKYEDIIHKKVLREVSNKITFGKKNI